MHEWALAEAVISTADKVAKEKDLKEVQEISIWLGRLQQIEMDIFEFAMKEIMGSRETLFKGTRLNIKMEEALLECSACGYRWNPRETIDKLNKAEAEDVHFVPEVAHIYMRCPECRSPDFKILKGRGVWVESISGE